MNKVYDETDEDLICLSNQANKTYDRRIPKESLLLLKAGNHKAFEKIFLTYYEKIKNFIIVLIRDEDLGDEMAQDIFAHLWQYRHQIDPDKNFNAYLYTIARNAVYNYSKRKMVRDKYVQNYQQNDEMPDAEEIYIADELELLIDIAVSRMPNQRRIVFEMSRNQGLSKDEIAVKLNISKNAVEKHLRFALQTLREIMAVLIVLLIK